MDEGDRRCVGRGRPEVLPWYACCSMAGGDVERGGGGKIKRRNCKAERIMSPVACTCQTLSADTWRTPGVASTMETDSSKHTTIVKDSPNRCPHNPLELAGTSISPLHSWVVTDWQLVGHTVRQQVSALCGSPQR